MKRKITLKNLFPDKQGRGFLIEFFFSYGQRRKQPACFEKRNCKKLFFTHRSFASSGFNKPDA